MPLRAFELACLPVLALAIALSARRVGWTTFARDYALLALAGLVGEATSIAWYRYYGYAEDWDARIVGVPLLVPLVWPLVILSAREVRDALFPGLDAARGALVVFVLVCADASMVEVLAVRAGLWSWAEGGHLGVPVLGVIAWGIFAGAADLSLARLEGRARLLVPVTALALAHALICASWWGCFRWVLRGDLGLASSVAIALLGAAATGVALDRRRRGLGIPREVALPRIAAAALFVVLFLATAPGELRLLAHVASIAIPYSAASMLSRRERPGEARRALDPREA